MQRRTLIAIGAAGFAAGLLPAVAGPVRPGPPEGPADEIGRLLHDLAVARRRAWLPDLAPSPPLTEAARRHARHLAAAGHSTHFGAGGEDPAERAAHAGYPGRILGEVLAETFGSPEATMEAWLQDPSSGEVLLDPDARLAGLAMAMSADGRTWWNLVLGN